MHVTVVVDVSFEAAVRAIVSQRLPRWTVDILDVPNAPDYPLRVVLEHPLSDGVAWSPSRHEVQNADTAFLEDLIQRDPSGEMRAVEQAPADCAHTRLLKALRRQARRFGWTHEECRALALIMEREAGVIDAAGAEWFANFTGTDAPCEHGPWPEPAG